MGNRRDPVSNVEMRAIKDELVERVTGQQKAIGMLPNVDAAEKYIQRHKILEKAERDHEEKRTKDIVRPKPVGAPHPGDGQLTALGRKRGVNLRGHKVKVGAPNKEMVKRRHARKKNQIAAWFRWLCTMPEWAKRIDAVVLGTSEAPGEMLTMRAGNRATLTDKGKDELVKIYEDSVRLFGDPLKPKGKKIIVG